MSVCSASGGNCHLADAVDSQSIWSSVSCVNVIEQTIDLQTKQQPEHLTNPRTVSTLLCN